METHVCYHRKSMEVLMKYYSRSILKLWKSTCKVVDSEWQVTPELIQHRPKTLAAYYGSPRDYCLAAAIDLLVDSAYSSLLASLCTSID